MFKDETLYSDLITIQYSIFLNCLNKSPAQSGPPHSAKPATEQNIWDHKNL